MKLFAHGHATHPDWRMAVSLAAAQIEAQRQDPAQSHIRDATLGWVYFTSHFAAQADDLLADLSRRWPGTAWVGASGFGVVANGVEYFDEPAVTLMLSDLPPTQFRVFSGVRPLGDAEQFRAHAAQVHSDASADELLELIGEMSERTSSRYLFGGLASGGAEAVHVANGVFQGGLSGVAFGHGVRLLSRVTQGCQPVGPVRRVTQSQRNVVGRLDGEPALDSLLFDLGLEEDELRESLQRLRGTLVGMSHGHDDLLSRPGQFGADTWVRHLIGIDPQSRALAISDSVETGMQLAFCTRNLKAARRDLVRICSEIREELEPDALPLEAALALNGDEARRAPHPARRIAGAIYVSCAGRGGRNFGAPSAELALVRHALGDVPLVGFFAGGEIARRHLYAYTGVLTVFTGPDGA